MANRRMFSMKIVDTDAFLDMPQSSQLLYYSLAMRADDDGFVSNPKKIMKIAGSNDDVYKLLVGKKFIIPFDSGVCVIKHWLIHNLIRTDRYVETQYIREKSQLVIDPKTKKYSLNKGQNDVIPDDNQRLPQVRLGKVRKDKKNTSEQSSQEIPLLIKEFESLNPSCKRFYGNKTQRGACEFLIKTYGFERLKNIVNNTLPKTNKLSFFPVITTPLQLQDKWIALESAIIKYQSENKKLKDIVAF